MLNEHEAHELKIKSHNSCSLHVGYSYYYLFQF